MKAFLFSAVVVVALLMFLGKYLFARREQPASTSSANYLSNPVFTERVKYFKEFQQNRNIVMLGNSHTFYGDWAQMLNRNDVVNQGIQGDVTTGFKERLNCVLNAHPRICFVEGGANDLRYASATTFNATISNLRYIVDVLKANNIIPVITTITYGVDSMEKYKLYNAKVYVLNQLIDKLALKEHIKLIDLNKLLCDNVTLNPRFATHDGGHYAADAYRLWANEVKKILSEYNI